MVDDLLPGGYGFRVMNYNERPRRARFMALVDLIFSTSVTHHEGAVSSVLFSLVFAPGRQHRTGRQPRTLKF